MLNRIFPELIDNHYRGHKFALWLFYPITFMEVAISLTAIFARDGGAQSADGIPLNTFGSGGAEAVIGVVAILGLARLLLGSLFVLALFRYRAMIPLMYVLRLLEYLGHKGIGWMKPIVRAGTPSGSYITAGLFTLCFIGLVLSLRGENQENKELSS
ncbi:MAG: hypothetical protein LAP21_08765 [Acidobacteriia bacterium]|nr:hypothetical protein [Terriglobia bacterium]